VHVRPIYTMQFCMVTKPAISSSPAVQGTQSDALCVMIMLEVIALARYWLYWAVMT